MEEAPVCYHHFDPETCEFCKQEKELLAFKLCDVCQEVECECGRDSADADFWRGECEKLKDGLQRAQCDEFCDEEFPCIKCEILAAHEAREKEFKK